MAKQEVERTTETTRTDVQRTTHRTIVFSGSKEQVDKAVDEYRRTGKLT